MSHSTLTLNANGSYDYMPYNNFTGSDSLTYTVTDAAAGESDTRTVDITVTAGRRLGDHCASKLQYDQLQAGNPDMTPFNRIMFARHIRQRHSDNLSDRR